MVEQQPVSDALRTIAQHSPYMALYEPRCVCIGNHHIYSHSTPPQKGITTLTALDHILGLKRLLKQGAPINPMIGKPAYWLQQLSAKHEIVHTRRQCQLYLRLWMEVPQRSPRQGRQTQNGQHGLSIAPSSTWEPISIITYTAP